MNNSLPFSNIAISGPTGSGKSSISIDLARVLDGEIINADSVQLFRGFDIGSAKITREEMNDIPHHLLSEIEPEASIDVWQYSKLAWDRMDEIYSRKKTAILVGGSGLYLRAVLCGLVEVKPPGAKAIGELEKRELALIKEFGEKGLLEGLYSWLKEVDPVTAQSIEKHDLFRVKRALLVFLQTGKALSQFRLEHANKNPAVRASLVVAILPERKMLYQRINERVERMFKEGLVEEVEKLLEFYPQAKALDSIGYRHIKLLLQGSVSREETIESVKRDTRRYAKRQITWWRNQPEQLGWGLAEIPGLEGSNIYDIPKLLVRGLRAFDTKKLSYKKGNILFVPFRDVKYSPH